MLVSNWNSRHPVGELLGSLSTVAGSCTYRIVVISKVHLDAVNCAHLSLEGREPSLQMKKNARCKKMASRGDALSLIIPLRTSSAEDVAACPPAFLLTFRLSLPLAALRALAAHSALWLTLIRLFPQVQLRHQPGFFRRAACW